MNPRSFPKRLDSKTGCLRITVPENLDLALEGLIRKVLREQPKTDDIYAFAANYFETLLSIRDKAGVEYTVTQLCPFHDDEDAREMIVLAGTFPRHAPGKVQGKGPAPLKTEIKKETDKAEPEKGIVRSRETLKDSNPEAEKKQATPDLIKKLPLLAQNRGLSGEEVDGGKPTDLGPDRERTETVKEAGDEEEYLTSDPIKEFVEKELSTEGNPKGKAVGGEAIEASERGSPSPTAREGQNEEAVGGAPVASNTDGKKGARGEDHPVATDVAGEVIYASEVGGKRTTDPEIRETDEKRVEAGDLAKDEGDKIGEAAKPEAAEERPSQETQQKREKENEEETSKLRAEEESQNKKPDDFEAPLPPLPPSPGVAEKHARELVHEVSPTYNAEAEILPEPEGGKVTQSAVLLEEKGIAEAGGAQQSAEDKGETDAQPSITSPMKTAEESLETYSPVTNSSDPKPVGNDDATATETDISQKSDRKEAASSATECMTLSEGEAQEPKTESALGLTERHTNSTETGSSPERGKGVQQVKEGGVSFEEDGLLQTKGVESNKGRENQDTKADEPSKQDLKYTEEGAGLTSASAVKEHATGQPRTSAQDSTRQPGEERGTGLSGKLDPGQKADCSEILEQEQFSLYHLSGSNTEAESKLGDEEEKAVRDKKSYDEDVKAKDQSLTERTESPGNQTSQEQLPLQRAEEVQCPAEATTDADGRQTPPKGVSSTTEAPKSEDQGGAKQEAPRDGSSPAGDYGRLTEAGEAPEIVTRENESAKPQESKTEDAPTADSETASLANEEPCSVVDISHLKRDEGNQEEPELAKPLPENTSEKSAPEAEDSPFPSLHPSVPSGETWGENRRDKPNFREESEAEDAIQGKAESEGPSNATAIQEPANSETDNEKGNSAEKTPPATGEGFEPVAEGNQIIIVEEPETTNENPQKSSPPGEIQIKTIQTHYYDTLRVPEAVTREYRVREAVPPTIDVLLGAASPPPSAHREVQESPGDEERSGRLTDDTVFPPTPKTSPTSDGDASTYAGAAGARSHLRADAADGSDRDAQASDSDDLPRLTTPNSASNLAELSFQAANETFLTNEKRFSSLEKEEIRFVTHATEEVGKDEPGGQLIESGGETDERGDETALPPTAGARPAPRTQGKTEAGGPSAEEAEHVEEDEERPAGSSGGSPPLSDGRAANGDPPVDSASGKPVSELPPRGEDESVPDAPRPPSGTKPEQEEDVRRRTATAVDGAEKESFHEKTRERNVPESRPEEVQAGSRREGRPDGRSTDRTPTGEASCAETDSTPSGATAEGRTDSVGREFASARGLSSARSLDLGKRNPLLRTRSLSTHRHGVADFEVWSTIEKELEEAATKIQSNFRGYKTRKKLRREVAVQISTEESSKRSTPVEADDADDRSRATGEFHDGIVLAEHPR